MPTLLLLLAALSTHANPQKDNWPGFRGPKGDGHADAAQLPIRWSDSENIRWKAKIPGKAWSSPVVWGERVWLTNAPENGKELSALALDCRTGKILIDVKVFDNPKPEYCHPVNSYASSTPFIEEGRVYVHFGSAGTACLDTATGKTIWSRRDFPCNHYRGPASSPVLHDGLLFIHFDGIDKQYLVALDARTGQTVWKKDRTIEYGTDNGDAKKAYSTPTVIEVAGKPQLISPAAVAVIAYEPRTGEELWKIHHGGINAAARPILAHGLVYICTGDFGWRLFAVRPDGKSDVTKSHLEWKYEKAIPTRSSPLLVGDSLYTVDGGGVVNCLEARTGKLIRQERLKGQFSASPLYAGGKVYFFSEDGMSYVIEPGQEWKVLAANKLPDGCMASPAVAGKSLLLRTRTHLYCIEGKE